MAGGGAPSASHWVIWQLADSAFPAGGLNHSQGLEASVQAGRVTTGVQLRTLALEVLHSQASTSLPIVNSCHADASVENVAHCDATSDSNLAGNHVAQRASIAQGKGLMAGVTAAYPALGMKQLRRQLEATGQYKSHLAPLIGMVCSRLGIGRQDCARLFLFIALRSVISAAVRLGVCGPLEGQSIQASVAAQVLDELAGGPSASAKEADGCAGEHMWTLADSGSAAEHEFFAAFAEGAGGKGPGNFEERLFQTSPMVDLLQGTQDRLFSKLFSS